MDESVVKDGVPVSEARPVAPERGQSFGAMRYGNYRLYWSHNVVMNIGEHVGRVVSGWYVWDLTNSPFILGATRTALTLPTLMLSLVAGVAADKIDRRLLMLIYLAIGTVNLFLFALLVALGVRELWPIFLYSIISGAILGGYFTTRRAILPMLVERKDLISAVALGNLTPQLGAVIGGIAAGWIVAAWGIASGLFIASSGWAASIAFMYFVTIPTVAVVATRAKTNPWADLLEGLRYVKNDSVLMTIMLFAFVPSLLGQFYQALLPVFAADILNAGAEGLGMLTAMSSLGYAASSFVLSALGDFRKKGLTLVLAASAVGATAVMFSFSRWYIPSLFFVFAIGATSGLNSTLSLSLLQLHVPDRLRGRITGIWVLTMPGTAPIGPFVAGILADYIGVPLATASGGFALIFVALLMALVLPGIKRLD